MEPITEKRRRFVRRWKAWRMANEIRTRVAQMTGNRNGPAKHWADECRVMMMRARRELMMELRRAGS
jgi:hypothetical protein